MQPEQNPTPEDRWRADVAARWEEILRLNAEGIGSAVYEDQEACRLALAEIGRLRARIAERDNGE